MWSTLVKAQPFGGKSSNSHRFPNWFSFVSFWKSVQNGNHSIVKVATAAVHSIQNVNRVLVVFLNTDVITVTLLLLIYLIWENRAFNTLQNLIPEFNYSHGFIIVHVLTP